MQNTYCLALLTAGIFVSFFNVSGVYLFICLMVHKIKYDAYS